MTFVHADCNISWSTMWFMAYLSLQPLTNSDTIWKAKQSSWHHLHKAKHMNRKAQTQLIRVKPTLKDDSSLHALIFLYKLIFTPQFWQPDTIYHFHFHFHFDLQCETYSDLYKLFWLLEQNISNLAEENQLIRVKYICDIMTLCCDIVTL